MLDRLEAVAQKINDMLAPAASFAEGYVWSWPQQVPLLAVVLLGTGVLMTLKLALIQVRGFKHAVDITRGKYDDPEDAGDVVHFQALTTALSATVGIGNIAGVAIAIRMGGPGALFWMWVTAFLGMSLKFAECTLAVRYRTVHADGSVSGGPMYYIERGLGARWKWMAMLFAGLAVICSFGTGNMNQANTMADQLQAQFGIAPVVSAIVAASVVALVIVGGIKRIGRVTSILAPAMALLYVGGALVILALNAPQVPSAFGTIVTEAFAPTSMGGGAAGSLLLTMMWGIRRGLFSNEAGQGSAPIAHAAAKTDEPVREGLVASLEPFIDTLVICTMTGLVIVTTGVWQEKTPTRLTLAEVEGIYGSAVADEDVAERRTARVDGLAVEIPVTRGFAPDLSLVVYNRVVDDARWVDDSGEGWSGTLTLSPSGSLSTEGASPVIDGSALITGAPLTATAFGRGLPGRRGDLVVTFSVLLFAISTAISWSYYGDRATEYLFGARAIPVYRWIYVGFFFLGCLLPLQTVWTFGDVALGLMSFPNLIALILLSGTVRTLTKRYFESVERN